MKIHRILLWAVMLLPLSLQAQQVYKIYEGVAPGSENDHYKEFTIYNKESGKPLIYNVTEPTITVYKPEKSIDTGAAMIIAPGGGNVYLTWEEEGINVAQWFQRHGVTGIILKYRTNFMGNTEEEISKNTMEFLGKLFAQMGEDVRKNENTKESKEIESKVDKLDNSAATIQGDDGRQAVKYVRAHAQELGIQPDKIGLMGFSAGGMVTCNVMAFHDKDSRPDLVAPIYGPVSLNIGNDPMPAFICGPEFDLFQPDVAYNIYKQWQAAHQPAELHFITDATHGQGLLYNGRQWNEWIDLLYSFMKAVKFIP